MGTGGKRSLRILARIANLPIFFLLFSFQSVNVNAESGRADYDLDDDGLIEINDLADLNEIRNHLDGTALYGSSEGCPAEGCNGFELTTDLDFDADGSGEIEASEEWVPVTNDSASPFTATFDGNYHSISNVYSDDYNFRGFFGYLDNAYVSRLVLENVVTRGHTTFAIAANNNTTISEVISRGSVISTGKNNLGGLLVYLNSGSIVEKSIFEGTVSGYNFVAGFIVSTSSDSIVRNSFSTGLVIGRSSQALGGFIAWNQSIHLEGNLSLARVDIPFAGVKDGFAGNISDSVIETNSYWDTELSTAPDSLYGTGYSTEELVCPATNNNAVCSKDGSVIYEDWDNSVWDFGDHSQYPGLKINNQVIRPTVMDSDADGIADYLDAFPQFAGASVDDDGDGIADACHPGFESNCTELFGAVSDAFLNDSDNDGVNNDISTDDDGDGIDDIHDLFPLDAGESADTDGDGVGDNQDLDKDGNGMLELRHVSDLDLIRALDEKYHIYEGCQTIVCRGFELLNDLDFDTNGTGDFDIGDSHWNEGQGWEPLVVEDDIVVRIEGNNHAIKNLYIDREGQVGLIHSIDIGQIKELKIEGDVKGTSRSGMIAGYARSTRLEEVLVMGSVSSTGESVGGLFGSGFVSTINQSAFIGSVTGESQVGGLIGYNHNSGIYGSFSSGFVSGDSSVGGLVGYRIANYGNIRDSYSVAQVTANRSFSGLIGKIRDGDDENVYESYWDNVNTRNGSNGIGLHTSLMLCPQSPSDVTCSVTPLVYEDWDSAIWDFGSNTEYPAIKMSRGLVRPSVVDSDLDSQPDYLDAFPDNPAATLDSDFDGMPESWAVGCDLTCQQNSGLVIDTHENDTDNDGQTNDVDADIDNDGVPNGSDALPYDPTETSDIDDDGIGDNRDVDDNNNNLIDISTLAQLQAFGASLDPSVEVEAPEGCPAGECLGVELLNDLDFDVDGNGVFDINDGESLWNDGLGWEPLGSYENRFSGTFEGNGYSINNLYVNRPSESDAALIAAVRDAHIQNLRISGFVNGNNRAALLVGYSNYGTFTNIVVQGRVKSNDIAGGLIGENLFSAEIRNIYVNVHASANRYAGGIIGRDQHGHIFDSLVEGVIESVTQPAGGISGYVWGTDITNSVSVASLFSQTGRPADEREHGGIKGYGTSYSNINSYWAHDVSELAGDQYSATLSQLQCPIEISNTSCAPITLYQDWDLSIWDLGTTDQLPGLVLSERIYRPSWLDSDGDRYPDHFDDFPDNPAVAEDTDGDGYPDSWAQTCNADCQENSDLTLDAFPEDSSEWLDTDGDLIGNNSDPDDDGDGYNDDVDAFDLDPNEWSDFDGDLIGDNADTDDDNDGVLDEDDENLGQDDGAPYFVTTELEERNQSVTTENGRHGDVNFDASYFIALGAEDVFDSTLIVEGYHNDQLLTLDSGTVQLPAGRQVIEWIAIDDAGNRSEPLVQVVNVYPRVRFDLDASVVGEGTDAQVVVHLTGDSPEYPVVVNLQMNVASDVDQDDLDAEIFDTALVHQVTITQGEGETLNREATLSVPVLQDNVFENDELMLIDLLGVQSEEGEENFFVVDETHNQHSLTVTYENAAPAVQIQFEQGGATVSNITLDAGIVTVTANVTDEYAEGVSYQWTMDDRLDLAEPSTASFNFDPSALATGIYNFSVEVTDNGLGRLTATASENIELVWFNGFVDTDGDGLPNNCPPECITLGMEADTDDDNDGVLDVDDFYQLISLSGRVDTNGNGIPDNCDTACEALGMTADTDDDGDGIPDTIDVYDLIPIGDLTDTDGDGAPDTCDPDCLALLMFADDDDDNDGIPDELDAYRTISITGFVDTDFDGAPDDCSAIDCIGMASDLDDDNDGIPDVDDAYRTVAIGDHLDTDGDGAPDNCDATCAATGMEADTDDDNDGVADIDDPSLGEDNGAPELSATLVEQNIQVSSEHATAGFIIVDESFYDSLNATDAVDSDLSFQGIWNGNPLVINNENQVWLSAGRQVIEWVAIDDAGNQSESIEQIINVYPQVRFDLDASIVGEGTDAQVVVRLTGDSPEYPVVVNLQMNVASDVDQDDLDAEIFDTALVHQVTITQGEGETLNREATLSVPVLQDNVFENDELMLIDLLGVQSEEGQENFFVVDETHNQHSLTVTYENAAPAVQIQFEQGGSTVSNITLDAGIVTVTANVTDEYAEGISYQWTMDDRLDLAEPSTASFNFDPSALVTGVYNFAVEVTDNGLDSLTATASENIELVWFSGFVDTDGDGLPNNCPPECITLGMEADTDDDNDGVLDVDDFYPLISLGSLLDTDGDGVPNSCDAECLSLGMQADADDDNDGVLDGDDVYPLVSLDGRLDSDGDGAPDDCNPACPLPMLADADDDNDGVPDEFDVFDLDPSEWADFDGDLIGDNADTDDDNDGVEDDLDPNLGDDNGAPVFDANLAEQHVRVTSEHGSAGFITIDESFYDALNATDAVDTELVYQGTWNNNPLVINDENQVWLSAGRQVIEWVAIDDAGNQSESIEQIINVYPKVRFDLDSSVSGEGSDASVVVRLTGDSPVYPVVVNLEVNGLSEVDQLDVASEFDLALPHQVTITQGDSETSLNREAVFTIPVLQDNVAENDEQLLVDLTGVAVAEGEESYFVVDETHQQFSLTITEQNLAPTVALILKQNDQEVANIATDGGLVTVSVVVTDLNGSDTHTYAWDVGELPLSPVTSSELVFDPTNLEAGTYNVSVIVTDSGMGSLTADASLQLTVTEQAPPVVEPEPEPQPEPEVAPTLQLILLQDGQQVANVQQEGGLVTVRAVVTDPNTGDTHDLNWDLSALGLNAPDGSELTFDPVNIPSAVYTIEVTVTDSENLTSTQSMTIAIVSESDGRTTGSGDSGSSGGGPILWLLMLLMSAGMVRMRSR